MPYTRSNKVEEPSEVVHRASLDLHECMEVDHLLIAKKMYQDKEDSAQRDKDRIAGKDKMDNKIGNILMDGSGWYTDIDTGVSTFIKLDS